MALFAKFPVRRDDKSNEIVKAVNQATDVSKVVEKAVSLPNYHCLLSIKLHTHTAELVLSVWVLEQVIGPWAWQLLIGNQLVVLYLLSLAKLDQVCFIFKLLHHELEENIARCARIKLHYAHARLSNNFVVPILFWVETLIVVHNSHLNGRAQVLELLLRVVYTLLA